MTHNSQSLLLTLRSQWSPFSMKQMSHMRFMPFEDKVSLFYHMVVSFMW